MKCKLKSAAHIGTFKPGLHTFTFNSAGKKPHQEDFRLFSFLFMIDRVSHL